MNPAKFIYRAPAWIVPVLFLFSCASYNQRSAAYYNNFTSGNYAKASHELDHNKLLRKDRNRLLYLLEKGKMEHLQCHYEESNVLLNEADRLMEAVSVSAKDIAAGTLLNPMMETYRGEDFEKYMVHYYKAMNYLQLGLTEDALVEARRISLRTKAQEDKAGKNKYDDDAFSLMLQGMIYEKGGDVNNAFIAYRNAADVYIESKGNYYGTEMPLQLKKDLLRTAYQNGFVDEAERYQKILNIDFDPKEQSSGGELILFWENGRAPVKTEENLFFTLTKNGAGDFFFADNTGSLQVPFDYNMGYSRENLSATDLRTFRAAISRYQQQPVQYRQALLIEDSNKICFERAQNINELAIATLQERRLKDLSKTLTRIAVKKLAEQAARPKEDEKNEKKKDRQEAMATGLQLFSLLSEKADTRNWQSLPHSIYYTRIALKPGQNTLTLQLNDDYGRTKEIRLTVENKGGLQFKNLCTL